MSNMFTASELGKLVFRITGGAALCVFLWGCELSGGDDSFLPSSSSSGTSSSGGGETSAQAASNQAASGTPTASSATADPATFALGSVAWLNTNVSGWPQTASLNARVSGGSMIVDSSKKNSWPSRNAGGTAVNANPWIFVFQSGRWYGATWEWLRPGQSSKPTSVVNGAHIKKSPLNNFRPQSGQTYGFMVSGLARDQTRNVQERSNVVFVRWP